MPAKVTLTVVEGALPYKEIAFVERAVRIIGRSEDCDPLVPDEGLLRRVSRHHCLLDVNPPDIRVRDFGSRNGTFVNGEEIGRREKHETPEEGRLRTYREHDLKDGDELWLARALKFRVSIVAPALCADCGDEIPEERREALAVDGGNYRCDACRRRAEARLGPKRCSKCGRDVERVALDEPHGIYLCASCRRDPLAMLHHLVQLADAGATGLAPIRNYRLKQKLGQGGYGIVYLAEHETSGEQVALKLMLPHMTASRREREKFEREVENTRALRHPNVVAFRDSGVEAGAYFFTMEYCEGGSVYDLMKARGRTLPVEEAVEITLQALAGLDYAHHAEIPKVKLKDGTYAAGKGLVHRDIKPSNLLLSGSGSARVVRLADYGLAKSFDHAGLSGLSMTGSTPGSPWFMPFQQASDYKYAQPDVDVWAMAAALYNMLTGLYPRNFPAGAERLVVVLTTSAVPIRKRNPAIPERLAAVIDAALVDRPDIGIRTAAELRRALEGAF